MITISHSNHQQTMHKAIRRGGHRKSSHSLQASCFGTNKNHHHKYLKLSLPGFNGEEPTWWVYKAEQYFDFKNIASNQQVQLTSFHLNGIALQWHHWFTKFRTPHTRDEFTKVIFLCFSPIDYEDPSKSITRLRKRSTIVA